MRLAGRDSAVARKVIDAVQLDKPAKFASSTGVDLRDALVQQKVVRPDLVMPAYAESIGLPYLDVQDLPIDVRLPRMVSAVIAKQHSCIPVMVDEKQLIMASPNPLDPTVEDQLRLRFGMPVRTVFCTAAGIHELITSTIPARRWRRPMPPARWRLCPRRQRDSCQ